MYTPLSHLFYMSVHADLGHADPTPEDAGVLAQLAELLLVGFQLMRVEGRPAQPATFDSPKFTPLQFFNTSQIGE